MFITICYKIFFKIILHKYLIKSSLTLDKFYNVVSSDNGIKSLNNLTFIVKNKKSTSTFLSGQQYFLNVNILDIENERKVNTGTL